MTALALLGGLVWSGLDPRGEPERADVLVADGVVRAIGTALDTRSATVVDASGCTIVPGLVDAHVHLAFAGPDTSPSGTAAMTARAVGNLGHFLRAGVTTVRDNGGNDGVAIAVRQAVQRAWFSGPAVFAANQYVAATGGHGAPRWGECGCQHPLSGFAADGPDEMRRAVRYQVGAGADHIKVTLNSGRNRVELTEAEMLALVDEAHRMGKRVAVHASIPDAVALAVHSGADTIEHGNGASREVLALMAERGTVLVPTAAAFRQGLARSEQRVAAGGADAATLSLHHSWQRRVDDHVATLRDALDLGVTIAVGTDVFGPEPVCPIADEMAALVDLGLTPLQALTAATVGGASAIGDATRGVLAEGGRADLAVFPGRPDLRPDDTRSPRLVVVAGHAVVTS